MKHPVSVRGLTKRFGAATALDGIDLEIESGEFVALLGPSGCGKTTTLRCLAGLEDPTEGSVRVGDQTFVDVANRAHLPTHRREIGMVFQSYALWPHRTVRSNVAYPLRLRGEGRAAAARQAGEMLDSVGLGHLAARYPHELSGGQQQRVALARGLASAKRLMLFDEPLSNLDAALRLSMRAEIRRLHDRFGHTSVYVTHDQGEALAMADRVVVMRNGRIEQQGSPSEVFERPKTVFVATFLGMENVFDARAIARTHPDDEHRSQDAADTGLRLSMRGQFAGMTDEASIGFRAGDVVLGPASASTDGLAFTGRIVSSAYAGTATAVALELADGSTVHASVPSSAGDDRARFDIGTTHDAHVPADRLTIIPEGMETP